MIVLDWNKLRLILGDFLDDGQVQGFNAVISELNKQKISDKRIVAYILATCVFETSKRMQPKEESGTDEYFRLMYDITGERSSIAIRMGNTEAGDGLKYKKRGIVQILGKKAYQVYGDYLKQDFVYDPSLVLTLENSVNILVNGMLSGWFTGVTIYNYITPSRTDYINARRTVNGTEDAKRIALMTEQLIQAIKDTV